MATEVPDNAVGGGRQTTESVVDHTGNAGEERRSSIGEDGGASSERDLVTSNPPEAGPSVISLRSLRKTFRSRRRAGWRGWRRVVVEAVAGIDLDVRAGEIFGFLGPNGAGKTTTIKMLMGLIRPSGGELRLFGGPPDELFTRARIGYLPEHPYFYDYLRPDEILDFYARLFRLSRAVRRRRIDSLLSLVGLEHARHRKLRTFSKGMLQRVGIASALVNEPDLVVLDEPLSGLDPIGRKEMRDIIVGLRDQGRSVFVSSHILSDIELVCDRVAIIDRGSIRSVGTLDELMDEERVQTEIIVSAFTDLQALERAVPEAAVERIGSYHRLRVHEASTEDALRVVLEGGGKVESVTRSRETLEELFMKAAVRTRRSESQ